MHPSLQQLRGKAVLETFVGARDISIISGNNKATTVTGYYMKKFLNEKNTNFDIDGSDSFWWKCAMRRFDIDYG